MPKQLGKGIDKEAMFKKIMPSASKPQNTAAAFNPDADGFSASPSPQNAADTLDLDGDFGSLDMLDSLGSFDALDSFDLFDEPELPRKAEPKKTAKASTAKKTATKSPTKPAAKTATKASAKAAAKSPPAPPIEAAQTPAESARARAQMPFPINTTAPLAAPAAPTASIAPEELDLPFTAPPEMELPVRDKPSLPFPINTSAPMAAPAAPTAPVPPPVTNEFVPSHSEGYQLDTQFDLMNHLTDPPQNYAIPGGTVPPRTPDPIQPQAIQQPGLPAQQSPALSQPLMPQEFMMQSQQQLMQQMQQMYQQMQQQMQQQLEQQMQQQLQQQKMLQQQLEQQLAASVSIATTPPPLDAASFPPSPTEAPSAVFETTSGKQDVADASIETAADISAPVPIDPLALTPVNLSAMQLTPRLDGVIERLHACNCEQCKLDTVAFALNQLPVHYTLSGQVTEEDLCNRASVSQVVSALCHAVLFVKSHPRH